MGALCGAVAFAIVDRLHQERERRSSTHGRDSPTADEVEEARRIESSPTTTPAPIPGSPEDPVASGEAVTSQDSETSDRAAANRNPSAQLPGAALSAGAETRDDGRDSKRVVGSASDEESPSAAQPDDAAWGPFMEQTLRQFLASHRAAPQFDILSIQCTSRLCEIRAVGFDESAEPVWSQVVYDIRQQPWAEFGQTGSSWGRVDGRFVVDAKLWRLSRK